MISKPQIANTIGCSDGTTIVRMKLPYPVSGRHPIDQNKVESWSCVYTDDSSSDRYCTGILVIAALSSPCKLVSSLENEDFVLMDFSFDEDAVADSFIEGVVKYLNRIAEQKD